MKRAPATELLEDAVPVLVLRVTEDRLRRLFPVDLTDADPWSEPEPSKGALIRLRSGGHVLLMYGLATGRATVSVPVSANATPLLIALLAESDIRASEVEWIRDSERHLVAAPVEAPSRPALLRSAVGKPGAGKRRSVESLRNMTTEELRIRERELRAQLFKLRFQRATGRIQNPARMRALEREIGLVQSLLELQSKKHEA